MNKTGKQTLTIDQLSELIGTVSNASSLQIAFAAVENAANKFIGQVLFTVMAFDERAMQVQRIYSNNPEAYPPGGKKDKRETQWGRHVLQKGRPFIGLNSEDIRANFNDHELIMGLGLGSVLNVPVRVCGRTIGTMNLLHKPGFYSELDLRPGFMLASLLVGPICIGAL